MPHQLFDNAPGTLLSQAPDENARLKADDFDSQEENSPLHSSVKTGIPLIVRQVDQTNVDHFFHFCIVSLAPLSPFRLQKVIHY